MTVATGNRQERRFAASLLRSRSGLYRWQAAVTRRAATGKLLIAAQMGSGKTIVMLTAIADQRAAERCRRVAVCAPRLILDSVWQREAQAWAHTSHLTFDMAHRIGPPGRERQWFEGTADIVTTTPDLLPQLVQAIIARKHCPFAMIYVDESAVFKNAESLRSRALLALGRILGPERIVLASGTPLPNGAINAWVPGRLLSPDNEFFAPEFPQWRALHFVQGSARYIWKPRAGTAARAIAEISNVGVSMLLRDTSDVPIELYSRFPFKHDIAHQMLIQDFLEQGVVSIEGHRFGSGDTEGGGFLVRLQELTQGFAILGEPGQAHILSTARAEALRDVVEQTEGPVLIASKFRGDLALIRTVFPDFELIDGSTPPKARLDIIDRWNADRIPLLVAHQAALAHGVNLQLGSARTIVWFAGSFSWELFAQFNARLVRQGQQLQVSIVTLASTLGIDHAIATVLDNKASGEAALMKALEESGGAQ